MSQQRKKNINNGPAKARVMSVPKLTQHDLSTLKKTILSELKTRKPEMKTSPPSSRPTTSKSLLTTHDQTAHVKNFGSPPSPYDAAQHKRLLAHVDTIPLALTNSGMGQVNSMPTLTRRDDHVVIEHTEPVPVTVDQALTVLASFNQLLYPTNTAVFNILPTIASLFNLYFWEHVEFKFISSTNDTVSGMITCGYFPDPQLSVASTTQAQVLNWKNKSLERISRNASLDLASRDIMDYSKLLYITSVAPTPGSSDTRQEAPGVVKIFVSSGLPTATFGILMVKYRIRLYDMRTTALSALGSMPTFASSVGTSTTLTSWSPVNAGGGAVRTAQGLHSWINPVGGLVPIASPSFGAAIKTAADGVASVVAGTTLSGITAQFDNASSASVTSPLGGSITAYGGLLLSNLSPLARIFSLSESSAVWYNAGTTGTVASVPFELTSSTMCGGYVATGGATAMTDVSPGIVSGPVAALSNYTGAGDLSAAARVTGFGANFDTDITMPAGSTIRLFVVATGPGHLAGATTNDMKCQFDLEFDDRSNDIAYLRRLCSRARSSCAIKKQIDVLARIAAISDCNTLCESLCTFLGDHDPHQVDEIKSESTSVPMLPCDNDGGSQPPGSNHHRSGCDHDYWYEESKDEYVLVKKKP